MRSNETPGQVDDNSFPKLVEDKNEDKSEDQSEDKKEKNKEDIGNGKNRENQKALLVEPFDKTLAGKWSGSLVELRTDANKENVPINLSPRKALAAKWNSRGTRIDDGKKGIAQKENVWWRGAVAQNDDNAAQAKTELDALSRTKVNDTKWKGAWGTKDVQESIAKARQKPRITPTDEQLAAATAPAPKAPVDALDIDDPRHPHFNASRYLCTIIDKYICPKPGCG